MQLRHLRYFVAIVEATTQRSEEPETRIEVC